MTFDPTARFENFDNKVDGALEHIRDYKFVKVVFSIASAVGDFGILWHIIGLLRAIGSVDRFQQALVFSTMIGIESLLLNQGIKRLFRRSRPTTSGDERFALRTHAIKTMQGSGHHIIELAQIACSQHAAAIKGCRVALPLLQAAGFQTVEKHAGVNPIESACQPVTGRRQIDWRRYRHCRT
jgi:hypothetical protein